MAAVPAGPEGDAMARQMLDAAWPHYPSLMPTLPSLVRAAEEGAHQLFDADLAILDARDAPIHTKLILQVGQFTDTAYSIPPLEGEPATSVMPIENSAYRRVVAHELAHTIHFQLASGIDPYKSSLGQMMFIEGLAMRVAQRAEPGRIDADYAAMPGDTEWMPRCFANKDRIIRGILPDLDKTEPKIAFKYTLGKGNSGMQREVYCAAWFAFNALLDHGRTLADLARLPADQMAPAMRSVLTPPGR